MLLIINASSALYVIVVLPYGTFRFIKQARANVKEKNRKIQNVTCLPVKTFESLAEDQQQDYCVICMEDFSAQSKVSWLPCDRRHFFHKECIMFWLVKQS